MSFDLDRLYALLPAVYRIRDAAQGEPLRALLSVIAEQIAVVEEDLAQSYDDHFIETCQEWVVPYIGDMLGVRGLHAVSTAATFSGRAYVANTLSYRRRKGTAGVLEQLARDVTNWDALALEFFQILMTTQAMNHLRPGVVLAPILRRSDLLEYVNTPFDRVAHTLDVRRIASRRGTYNIPNVGIFLWRLGEHRLTDSPAVSVDDRRYLFSPLGANTRLFTHPRTEDEETGSLTEPINVPMPISRRQLDRALESYYGPGASIFIAVDGTAVPDPGQPTQTPRDVLTVCDLSDIRDGGGTVTGWAHMPNDTIAIDPALGRLAFPADRIPSAVRVTFSTAFSANMGGGEYDRLATLTTDLPSIIAFPDPARHPTLQSAIAALHGSGGVEIGDNGRYAGPLTIALTDHQAMEVHAADGRRPTLVLGDATAPGDLTVTGGDGSELTLDGLLLVGGMLHVPADAGAGPNRLRLLRLRHCTLVPGIRLAIDGTPQAPDTPSLIVEAEDVRVEIDHCIIGAMRIVESASTQITASIVDALDRSKVAYASPGGDGAGAPLHVETSTIIGKVHTTNLAHASNTIFFAHLAAEDTWSAPVLSDRRQVGCVRFSYVPLDARVPRRYRCQPAVANEGFDRTSENTPSVQPQFTSLRFGDPGYCQLSPRSTVGILRGADDEAEMGAFHDLYQPQRETNLRVALGEYLRFSLEAGILYAT